MKTTALVALAASLLILPTPAGAQPMKLEIQNGRVSLDAQNVLVRQILAEWSRVGGAKVINAEKITGGPVTLQLSGVTERQALETILRNVAGYMLATRQPGSTGASGFDRILILPTSTAPRNAAAPAPGFGNVGGGRQMPPPQPADPINADPEPEEDQPQDEPADEEVSPAIGPAGMRDRLQRMQQLRQGGVNQMGGQPGTPMGFPQSPGIVQQYPGQAPMGMPSQGGMNQPAPQGYPPMQAVPSPVTTTPANPFGIPAGATSMPGVVTPVPETPTSPSSRPTTRPPR